MLTPQQKESEQGMLGFFHTIERLKRNKRTGWVNQGMRLPESIADHMYRMAMMALVMPEHDQPKLDIAKCVMMSIVHDMAEADVGDITPEHASGVTKAQKAKLEEEAMQRIFRLLGHPSISSLRIKSLWEEYEARQTPESKFVKDLDLFELAVQGVEYEASDECRTLQGFFETTVPRIQHAVVRRWARDLMEERKAAWASRGWDGYKHVEVASDETSPSSLDAASAIDLSSAAKIPIRVHGEHA